MWWRDFSWEASWENVQTFKQPKILAPSSKMYLDIYQTEPHAASRYRMQEGTFGVFNTYSAIELEDNSVIGVHTCLWSEHLENQDMLEYQMFPRGAAAAEAAWTTKANSDFV